MFISTTEEFFDAGLVSRYLDYCRCSSDWLHSKAAGIWSERIIHHVTAPLGIRRSNLTVLECVQRKIRKEYRIARDLYADYLGFVRWRTNDSQRPHADAENPVGSPHPFHWREFGCVLYLN